jgi:hypothetical protein
MPNDKKPSDTCAVSPSAVDPSASETTSPAASCDPPAGVKNIDDKDLVLLIAVPAHRSTAFLILSELCGVRLWTAKGWQRWNAASASYEACAPPDGSSARIAGLINHLLTDLSVGSLWVSHHLVMMMRYLVAVHGKAVWSDFLASVSGATAAFTDSTPTASASRTPFTSSRRRPSKPSKLN